MPNLSNHVLRILVIGPLVLLIIGVLNTPVKAAPKYHNFTVTNLSATKVNCPTMNLKIDFGGGSRAGARRGPKSLNSGETINLRLGTHSVCKKFWVEASCVGLFDGWPRNLSLSAHECNDIRAYFKANEKGVLVLSETP